MNSAKIHTSPRAGQRGLKCQRSDPALGNAVEDILNLHSIDTTVDNS